MKIKVTGYIDASEDSGDEHGSHFDPSHYTGLSENGHLYYTNRLASLGLEDLEFGKVVES